MDSRGRRSLRWISTGKTRDKTLAGAVSEHEFDDARSASDRPASRSSQGRRAVQMTEVPPESGRRRAVSGRGRKEAASRLLLSRHSDAHEKGGRAMFKKEKKKKKKNKPAAAAAARASAAADVVSAEFLYSRVADAGKHV
ncbi:hypothetical protein L1887_45965 [Cichorium endivia]|nr:hypothetical protein L1887_45965 [Cichorium endivia]